MYGKFWNDTTHSDTIKNPRSLQANFKKKKKKTVFDFHLFIVIHVAIIVLYMIFLLRIATKMSDESMNDTPLKFLNIN